MTFTHHHSICILHNAQVQQRPRTTTMPRSTKMQRRKAAVGLERRGQCVSTGIANPVVCKSTHSARRHWNYNRPTSTHHHTLTTTTAVDHAPLRPSVVKVLLDSSALASACTPASPIWLPVTALTQHGVTITTTAPHAHITTHRQPQLQWVTHSKASAWSECSWTRAPWPVPEHLHSQSGSLRPHSLSTAPR
jgi:hypothetical protein